MDHGLNYITFSTTLVFYTEWAEIFIASGNKSILKIIIFPEKRSLELD